MQKLLQNIYYTRNDLVPQYRTLPQVYYGKYEKLRLAARTSPHITLFFSPDNPTGCSDLSRKGPIITLAIPFLKPRKWAKRFVDSFVPVTWCHIHTFGLQSFLAAMIV